MSKSSKDDNIITDCAIASGVASAATGNPITGVIAGVAGVLIARKLAGGKK